MSNLYYDKTTERWLSAPELIKLKAERVSITPVTEETLVVEDTLPPTPPLHVEEIVIEETKKMPFKGYNPKPLSNPSL